MAIQNRIYEFRSRLGITQRELGKKLPGNLSNTLISLIENGYVLPTKQVMLALCDVFGCCATDLYLEDDLDVALSGQLVTSEKPPIPKKNRGAGHDGMTEFRAWIKPEEKANIETAVISLGYRNSTEWFREAYRSLMKDYRNISDSSEQPRN